MKIVSVLNQKGGSGKGGLISSNLAHGLQLKGNKVLLVDVILKDQLETGMHVMKMN